DRKWRDERTERRRAEVERDRLGAELQQVYAKQQADLEEMVEGHVAEIMDAAAVDGLSVAKSRVDPAAELVEARAATLQKVVDVLDAAINDRQDRLDALGDTKSLADRVSLGVRISAFKEARGYVVALQRGEQPFSAALAKWEG